MPLLRYYDGAQWSNVVVGAQGPTGAQGTTGATASQGTTGTQGTAGTQGIQGTQGLQGIADRYSTTSITSLAISPAGTTLNLTVGSGMGYTVGTLLSIYFNSTNYMTATVSSYTSSTGALSVSVTSSVGSGTYNSWTVNVSGATGTQGIQGISGTAVAQGATGAQGTTGSQGTNGTQGTTGTQGTQGLTGIQGSLTTNTSLTGVLESIQSIAAATAATTTYTVYVNTANTLYYTTASTAASTFNINVTGVNGGATLNSILAVGQMITVVFLNTTGAVTTSLPASPIQVDGTTVGVTMRWIGGFAPTAGNASSIDAYTYTIIKTASATYTVLAQQTRWA